VALRVQETTSASFEGYNALMEPRKLFVGQRVQLPNWHGDPDKVIDPPVVEEISTDHRPFSSHTLVKVSWSVTGPEDTGVVRESRLFRADDLRPA